LPFHRIQRAHKLGEIDLEKNPAPTGLGSRNETALGASADLFGMHMKERGGLSKIESFHHIGNRVELCRRP
jgi:hypothetical protein